MDFNPQVFTLEQRIIATLSFFEIFEFCLTIEEVHYFLLGNQETLEKLQAVLMNMSQISFKNGYYFLKGQEFLIDLTANKRKTAKVFWKKVNFYMKFLKMVPFIKFAAVCNNLAFNNVTEKSDIDLFIVTKKNRIFITRIFSTFFLHILGVRRHGKKISGRFCLSFYVAENAANFTHLLYKPYDIYFAFWLLSLKPILKSNYFLDLVSQNKWLENYFVSTERILNFSKNSEKNGLFIRRFFEVLLKGKLGDFLERKLSEYFLIRYKKRALALPRNASVVVSDLVLKYHNDDRRFEIRRKFEKRLEDFKI